MQLVLAVQALKTVLVLAGGIALGIPTADAANPEAPRRGGQVQIPGSSIEEPGQVGVAAHTNIKLFVLGSGVGAALPPSRSQGLTPQQGPPAAGYFFETPASLGCVYNLVSPVVAGCNPNSATTNPSGGARAIAIVDAYHYPTALSDLTVFSAQFGLPSPTSANFKVVYASGRQPPVNADWNIEEALDIEWAHAMAPQAKIYLVEAASSSFSNLLTAVSIANSLVKAAGGGEVSMSWGGSEFSAETSYNSYFAQSGVVYFASSGDSPGVIWPSASPNVVSVGGTSISRNPVSGDLQQEIAWQSGGGGASLYEARPGYQAAISAVVGSRRGSPDVAADADPATGVWVYDYPYWYIVGGTSVAAPVWAGIVNAGNGFSATSQTELATVYGNSGNGSDFGDITQGSCGPNEGYLAVAGWDFCTGIGAPLGRSGK